MFLGGVPPNSTAKGLELEADLEARFLDPHSVSKYDRPSTPA